VVGAAIATVIARWAELSILLVAAYRKKYVMTGSFRELFGFRVPFVRRFFQIALPVMINELIWSAGITMQNIIFAQTSTEAIAAFSITTTVSQLNWVFFIGIGNAAGVLIGKKIGEGADGTAREYAFRIAGFAPLSAAGLGLLLIPLSWTLPLLFNVDANVFAIIDSMFIILALAYPFRAFNMAMIIGVCRAGGDTRFSVFYDVSFMWLFSIPLAALASFVFHVPAWLIYVILSAEDPLKMFFGLRRLKSGKWLHNVTE
jgi:Na+-driven multidrug efflux pump